MSIDYTRSTTDVFLFRQERAHSKRHEHPRYPEQGSCHPPEDVGPATSSIQGRIEGESGRVEQVGAFAAGEPGCGYMVDGNACYEREEGCML